MGLFGRVSGGGAVTVGGVGGLGAGPADGVRPQPARRDRVKVRSSRPAMAARNRAGEGRTGVASYLRVR